MTNFLGLKGEKAELEGSKVVVLSFPLESTVSYGSGTSKGPKAILDASIQVEFYDAELDDEPCSVGIHTRDELILKGLSPEQSFPLIEKEIEFVLKHKKFPLSLGGEHSLTTPIVKKLKEFEEEFTVLQFDAHADLREQYEGTPYSHASVMSRVREFLPAIQVGIRSLCVEEGELIKKNKYPVFFAHEMEKDKNWADAVLKSIKTKKVYVTFDIDAFDPSLVPTTGTPEPGGMEWYPTLDLLKKIGDNFDVVGADIVELAPVNGFHSVDFLTAKLAYKMIGYFCL